MNGSAQTWVYMAFPLLGLAINLVWPRKRSLKTVCIVLLLLTAYIHGLAGCNPLARDVAMARTGQWVGTPELGVRSLSVDGPPALETMFGVSLGLTLAVVFAATPADIGARIRSRFRKSPEAADKSRHA